MCRTAVPQGNTHSLVSPVPGPTGTRALRATAPSPHAGPKTPHKPVGAPCPGKYLGQEFNKETGQTAGQVQSVVSPGFAHILQLLSPYLSVFPHLLLPSHIDWSASKYPTITFTHSPSSCKIIPRWVLCNLQTLLPCIPVPVRAVIPTALRIPLRSISLAKPSHLSGSQLLTSPRRD